MDVDLTNPEVSLTVDRERALIEGVSSAQIGMQIKNCFIWERSFEDQRTARMNIKFSFVTKNYSAEA